MLLLFLSFTIFGCQNELSVESEPKLGKEFSIQNGEQLVIQGKKITVKFVEVLKEYRCPKGVECVWAGNAKIAIYLNEELTALNTNLKPRQIVISGYQIKLISLSPYPHIDKKIDPEDYTAKLIITEI